MEELNEMTEVTSYSIPKSEKISELMERKDFASIRKSIEDLEAVDIAEIIDELPEDFKAPFFRLLPKENAAAVFSELDGDLCEEIIHAFTDKELSFIISDMYLDDAVDIIEEMPANIVKRILRTCSPENREAINELLRYPEDSAGTVMTTEYVRLTEAQTVEAALSHIRRVAIDKETIYTCYVTDKDRHILGIVTAKELLIASPDVKIGDIMDDNVVFAYTEEDKESVARRIQKYGFLAMPVVDRELRLVGIVTVDDASRVLEEEVHEDISKMAAIIPVETPYLKTKVLSLFKARIPWLLLLMVSATISSAILGRFEATLANVLLLFVPMLMDTGGNSGSQASVTAIRALSIGEIEVRDVVKVLFKEIRVALLCGSALGVVAFGKVMLIDGLLLNNTDVTPMVGLTVSLTLLLTVLVAKIIGASLPIAAKVMHLDPAVMASPFITTIVDAVSLVLYYVASFFFIGVVA